jgi:hypothetical protein
MATPGWFHINSTNIIDMTDSHWHEIWPACSTAWDLHICEKRNFFFNYFPRYGSSKFDLTRSTSNLSMSISLLVWELGRCSWCHYSALLMNYLGRLFMSKSLTSGPGLKDDHFMADLDPLRISWTTISSELLVIHKIVSNPMFTWIINSMVIV